MTSAAPVSRSTSSKKRTRPTLDEIRRTLSLLNDLPHPLPPTLPPSPPASRSATPEPVSKRRRIDRDDASTSAAGPHQPQNQQRPGLSSSSASSSASVTPPSLLHPLPNKPSTTPATALPPRGGSASASSSNPAHAAGPHGPNASASSSSARQDRRSATPKANANDARASGKQRSPPTGGRSGSLARASSSSATTTASLRPIPKRNLSPQEISALRAEVERTCRSMKRSGESRLSNHPFFDKPSAGPPPAPLKARNTLIGLLEVTEAVVNYVYDFWLQDEIRVSRGRLILKDNWDSLLGLVNAVKKHWMDNAVGERQRAMLGLVLLIEGVVTSRATTGFYNEYKARVEAFSGGSGAANAPSPGLSNSAATAGQMHHHQRSSSSSGGHLAPPHPSAHGHGHGVGSNLSHQHQSQQQHGHGANHPTPPSMISPEPSPQASGSSASMLSSSPSPPTPRGPTVLGPNGTPLMHPSSLHRHSSSTGSTSGASPITHPSASASGPGSTAMSTSSSSSHASPSHPPHPQQQQAASPMPSSSAVWAALRQSQNAFRILAEATTTPDLLTPAVLAQSFPLTWSRCQTGSGARFRGTYAVTVAEGHTVDFKKCAMPIPSFERVSSSSSKAQAREGSVAMSVSTSGGGGSPAAVAGGEPEEGEEAEDASSAESSLYDDDSVYRDYDGARWAWPLTSGDAAPHLAGFGKSLLYELARSELGETSLPGSVGGAAYRGFEGINTYY